MITAITMWLVKKVLETERAYGYAIGLFMSLAVAQDIALIRWLWS